MEKSKSNVYSDPLRRANAAAFVECTCDLIESEGFDQLSIRKIADKAGFHNSTIYLYFRDANELIFLACVKYFEEYATGYGNLRSAELPPMERYYRIMKLFCEKTFSNPLVFWHIFFGKYSADLTDMFNLYYEIYPEKRESAAEAHHVMYFGKNITERCLRVLTPLCDLKGSRVTKDNLEQVNRLIVCGFKAMLEEACYAEKVDVAAQRDYHLQMLHVLIDA